jgi:nuclear cap-binding protein subunit 1
MIQSIQTYFEATTTTKWLVHPICKNYSDDTSSEFADELLDTLVSTLQMFDAADFTQTPESFVQPYASYPDHDPTTAPFVLPTVLVPPEVIELDSLSTESATVKKDDWPEYFLKIFDHDVRHFSKV